MNIAKNMEAIFIAALVLASATGLAHAAVPTHGVAHPAFQQATSTATMAATITGKHLSAAQPAAPGN